MKNEGDEREMKKNAVLSKFIPAFFHYFIFISYLCTRLWTNWN